MIEAEISVRQNVVKNVLDNDGDLSIVQSSKNMRDSGYLQLCEELHLYGCRSGVEFDAIGQRQVGVN